MWRNNPHSVPLRGPPLPHIRGVEERRQASRPALPLPRRAGERWPAKRTGVGVEHQSLEALAYSSSAHKFAEGLSPPDAAGAASALSHNLSIADRASAS